ncbi:hypothetical protein [Sporolactobacillus terrae]|uniref:Uncharacterized protein n=1 Tax=Sporolactobacillus terrae TaxID=269673 RepID=A0A410DAW2_9BACL|nr:hypothetical protein [Sporolactobacillus terrae]QAA23204.1 hypothetical protein C0674_11555 [Sporolactobacillus terrae]QAA26174.1 hypothetical protein C0679_11535 [Sporolactobacillus terrae]UAK15272.1 hypothetical protein K7399_09205 [Sporolactobacillus terrae]BBN99609.1 hypothetical protein St703_23140 [Sporolactobacillus terrae]
MLQNMVNELESGILNIVGNKVHVTGFTREEMLQLFLDTGIEAWSSKGLYNLQDLEFHNIKSNALIIVKKDGKELNRYQYKEIIKKTIKFKNEEGKNVSRTFIIRKSAYSDHYQFYFVVDKKKESLKSEVKQSRLFDNKEELNNFLFKKFSIEF